MDAAIKRRVISEKDALELVGTKPTDMTLEKLKYWLANTYKHTARFNPEDILDIPKYFRTTPPTVPHENEWDVRWSPNWNSISTTTVGRFIASSVLFSKNKEMRTNNPFIDKAYDKGVIESIQQHMIDLLLFKKLTSKDIEWFTDRAQWLGYAPTNFLAPSMTIDTIRLPKETARLKKEMLAGEHGDNIRNGDLKSLAHVEGTLIADAKRRRSNIDPGFDIYASGARGNIGNNFKQTAVMRGAIRKSDEPTKIHISTASLDEGIPTEEMHQYGDVLIQASFGRAMMTAKGGYIAKQMNAAFQSLVLNPDPESDCNSNIYLTAEVDNGREYLGRFYKEGSKLIEILPETAGSLTGKVLRFRSPQFCGDESGICSRCMGTMLYRLSINNAGLVTSRVGTTLMNGALKQFHDTSLKLKHIDISKYIREIK